jgi:ribosomal 30S subunit maturation factor RimM
LTLVSAGQVGRTHGRDGSFYVEHAAHELEVGTVLVVDGRGRRIERRGGTGERPLIRLEGIDDRESARALHGKTLLVEGELADDEWLASDLVGCRVEGMGEVQRVVAGPSCSLLELDDGTLVPFVSDALEAVDTGAHMIRANREFLGRT